MLVKRILNPSKKNRVEGNTFHLLFLGVDAVLYDALWDEAIIYGNKALVRNAIVDPKKLTTLLEKNVTQIILYTYKLQEDGELKKIGNPIRGVPTNITVPNY